MKTVSTVAELREQVLAAKQSGKKVGFVPTMGNLHNGHMTLVDHAVQACDFVVASIFVNPLQFNDKSDLSRYPRTLEQDSELLIQHKCDLLFAPTVDEMYPNGQDSQSIVSVPEVSMGLCGGARPGHFDGVATVVTKLFNMVLPDQAFFGEKDFQQLAVIRKMVADLCIPVEVTGVPTVRSANGLALSSRNGYLSEQELEQAVQISVSLKQLITDMQNGVKQEDAKAKAVQHLANVGFTLDYLEVYRSADLKPATTEDTNLVVLVAAFLGPARLIDNMSFSLNTNID